MASFGGFIDSFAKVLYVDGTSGLDTNTGSATSPFKTISKAVASVTTDKTLIYIVKEGTYTEPRLTSVLNANYEITIATITLRDKTKRVILSLTNVTAGGFIMNKTNTFIGLIIQRPSPGNDGRPYEYFFDGSVINLSFRNCVWDNKPHAPTTYPIFTGNSAGATVKKLEYINCSFLPIFLSKDTAVRDFINCAIANNFTSDDGNIVTTFDADYNPTTQTTTNGVYNGDYAWGSLKYIKVILKTNNKFISTIQKKISDSTIIPKMTNNAAPSGLAFSKGAMGVNEAYLAFNQTDENEGYCSTSSSGGVGFLGYKFTSPKIISQYAVRNGTLSSYYKRLPRDWTFEGSNNSTNGSDGTWEVLDRQSKQIWSTPTTDKVFEIDNIKAFNMYRLNWTANGGATDYTSVGELKMFELLTVPSLIVMNDNNENSFQKHGMNFDRSLNLSNRLNKYIDIENTSLALGLGKVFEHKVNFSRQKVNSIKF